MYADGNSCRALMVDVVFRAVAFRFDNGGTPKVVSQHTLPQVGSPPGGELVLIRSPHSSCCTAVTKAVIRQSRHREVAVVVIQASSLSAPPVVTMLSQSASSIS
jgi:hypothetical protein